MTGVNDTVANIQYNLAYEEKLLLDYIGLEIHNGVQYEYFLAEVKKPGASPKEREEDRRALVSEMKLSLNKFLAVGVHQPCVIGFLIQGKC